MKFELVRDLTAEIVLGETLPTPPPPPLVANHGHIPCQLFIFMSSKYQYREQYHNENFQEYYNPYSQSESEVENFVKKNWKNLSN